MDHDQDGIFYSLVVPESYVQQGMRVGYTTDYFGNKLVDIARPVSAVVRGDHNRAVNLAAG